jgi:hypothetical protein
MERPKPGTGAMPLPSVNWLRAYIHQSDMFNLLKRRRRKMVILTVAMMMGGGFMGSDVKGGGRYV